MLKKRFSDVRFKCGEDDDGFWNSFASEAFLCDWQLSDPSQVQALRALYAESERRLAVGNCF